MTRTVRAVTKREPRRTPGMIVIDEKPICADCGRTLFGCAARPWSVPCPRCRVWNESPGASFTSAVDNAILTVTQ